MSSIRDNETDGTTEVYKGEVATLRKKVIGMLRGMDATQLDTDEDDRVYCYLTSSVLVKGTYIGVWFKSAGEGEVAIRCLTKMYSPLHMTTQMTEEGFHRELKIALGLPVPERPRTGKY